MDELGARAAALAARHPRHARLRRVGTSRAGTPLLLLSVGHGSRHALVVAGPHANEPVGGATVLRLAERALADPRLTEGADATWNLLLCADPDGLRRNEGWLSGPYTLDRYARNFFRPGFLEQPEWLPDGPDHAALPETRTLLALQDELRPFLQCSLHGVDVGGGFVEVTHDLPASPSASRTPRPGSASPANSAPTTPCTGPASAPPSTAYRRPGSATSPPPSPRRPSTRPGATRSGTAPSPRSSRRRCGVWPPCRTARPRRPGRGAPRGEPLPARRHPAPAARPGRVRPHLATDPDAAHLLAPVDDYLLVCPRLADAWTPTPTTGRAGPCRR